MNYLSWLIYLADVSDSAKVLGLGTMFVTGFALGVLTIAYMAEDVVLPRSVYRILVALFVASMLLGIFAPKQRTMYLIAASEAGERAANSETGKAVLNETRDLLLKKLRELNAEK